MCSSKIRLLLAGLCFAIGGALLFWEAVFAWPMLAAGALFLWGYWRYGTVWLAFHRYRKGDIEAVERLLNQVSNAGALQAQQRAYYEFLKGVVQGQRGQTQQAKDHFLAALEGPLRTDRMRSIVHVHLAEVECALNDVASAEHHASQAREFGLPESLDSALDRMLTEGAERQPDSH